MFKEVNADAFTADSKSFAFVANNEPQNIHISSLTDNMTIDCNDLFDTIFAVPLETNNSSIIGYINEIQVSNDTIYVRDQWKTKSIKRYTLKGKYIDQIGKQGQGPGEYVEPTALFVDSLSIIVFDQWQHKLLEYNKDGTFLSEKRLPFLCTHFVRLPNSQYLFSYLGFQNFHLPSLNNYCLWQTDSTFKISRQGLFRPIELSDKIETTSPFSRTPNGYFYNDSYTDSLYFISNDAKLSCKYLLDIEDRTRETSKDFKINVYNCSMLNDYLCVGLTKYDKSDIGRIYNCIYSVETGRTFVGDINVLNSKNSVYRLGSILGVYDNVLITKMFAQELLAIYNSNTDSKWAEVLEKTHSQQTFEPFRKLCKNLQEDDNDVLIFFKLKDNVE